MPTGSPRQSFTGENDPEWVVSGHCAIDSICAIWAMQKIDLDGSSWTSEAEFYDSLAAALGSVEWHGRNANAFLETMIYCLYLNAVQPPYAVRIKNAPDALRSFLQDFAAWVAEARQDRKDDLEWGDDVEVTITVD